MQTLIKAILSDVEASVNNNVQMKDKHYIIMTIGMIEIQSNRHPNISNLIQISLMNSEYTHSLYKFSEVNVMYVGLTKM